MSQFRESTVSVNGISTISTHSHLTHKPNIISIEIYRKK